MPKIYQSYCKQCGNPYRGGGRYFCSRSCWTTYKNLCDNPAKRPEVKQKISSARRGKPTTLSRKHSQETKDKIADALRGKSLSLEHRQKISQSLRASIAEHGLSEAQLRHLADLRKTGPEHPMWQGGTTKERIKEYKSSEYQAFRQAVLERDDYTCQRCGNRGGKIEVHHILPYTQCVGPLEFLKYHLANGQTICLSCHNKTKKKPRPDLQKPNFDQFSQDILNLIPAETRAQFQ